MATSAVTARFRTMNQAGPRAVASPTTLSCLVLSECVAQEISICICICICIFLYLYLYLYLYLVRFSYYLVLSWVCSDSKPLKDLKYMRSTILVSSILSVQS